MQLIFYSGGDEVDNKKLDQALIDLSQQESPSITYIPSCSYDSEIDFYEFVEKYKKFNLTRFIHFPVDIPHDHTIIEQAFSSDIIHLSGGNTFYFLKYLRKYGYLKRIKEFVIRGGILTGLSAGSIIMTPNIKTASFPEFDRDDNDERVTNLSSLGLVNFEFFPHYRNSSRYDKAIISHSKKVRRPIYACPDGSGIIVNKGCITFIGRSWCFFKGDKFLVNKIPLSNSLKQTAQLSYLV